MVTHTHIHTYTHDNYYNPRCACARRVNNVIHWRVKDGNVQTVVCYKYTIYVMGMVATARDYSRSSLLFSLPSYPTLTQDGMVIIQRGYIV